MILPVALSNELVVDTILGNTVITKWEMELKYNPPTITSYKLRKTFKLIYHPTRLSLQATSAETHVINVKYDDEPGNPTYVAIILVEPLNQISNPAGESLEDNS